MENGTPFGIPTGKTQELIHAPVPCTRTAISIIEHMLFQ